MSNILTLEAFMNVNGLNIQHSSEWEDYLEMNANQAGMTPEQWMAHYGSSYGISEKKVTRKQLDKALGALGDATKKLSEVLPKWKEARDSGDKQSEATYLEELRKHTEAKKAAEKLVNSHIQALDSDVELKITESDLLEEGIVITEGFTSKLNTIRQKAKDAKDFIKKTLSDSEFSMFNGNDKFRVFLGDFYLAATESKNVNEAAEVTKEMWDKEWNIKKAFGKEFEEKFAKRVEAAMSKAKDEEQAEEWAYKNFKQLPNPAKGMTIEESVLFEATIEVDAMFPTDKEFLKFLKKNKVEIINKEMDGPAGHPVITMQGKRKDLEKVLADPQLGFDDPDLAEYIEESVLYERKIKVGDLVAQKYPDGWTDRKYDKVEWANGQVRSIKGDRVEINTWWGSIIELPFDQVVFKPEWNKKGQFGKEWKIAQAPEMQNAVKKTKIIYYDGEKIVKLPAGKLNMNHMKKLAGKELTPSSLGKLAGADEGDLDIFIDWYLKKKNIPQTDFDDDKKEEIRKELANKYDIVIKESAVYERKAPFPYNLGYNGRNDHWKYEKEIGMTVKDIEGIRDYHKEAQRGGKTAVRDISSRILITTIGQPDIKDAIIRALKGVDKNLDLKTIKNNYDASDRSRSKHEQDNDMWQWEIQKHEDVWSYKRKYGDAPKQDREFTHDHQMEFIDMLAPYSTTQHQLADIDITSLDSFLQYAADHVSAANLKKVTKRIKKEYPKLESNDIDMKNLLTLESFQTINEKKEKYPITDRTDSDYKKLGAEWWFKCPFNEFKKRALGKPEFVTSNNVSDLDAEKWWRDQTRNHDGSAHAKILKMLDKHKGDYKGAGDRWEEFQSWIEQAMIRQGNMVG